MFPLQRCRNSSVCGSMTVLFSRFHVFSHENLRMCEECLKVFGYHKIFSVHYTEKMRRSSMCAPTQRGAFSKNECVPIQCGIHPSVRTLTMDGFHTPTSPFSVRLPLRALKTCGLCKLNVVALYRCLTQTTMRILQCGAPASIEDLKLKDFPESGCLKIKNRMPRAKRAATAVTIRKIQDSDRSAACMPSFVFTQSLALSA